MRHSPSADYGRGSLQLVRGVLDGQYDEQVRCITVAGWRLMATTVAIRKLYIDDLGDHG
jgi:hypothetical protein